MFGILEYPVIISSDTLGELLGQEVRRMRISRKLTQTELGNLIGVSKNSIHNIEKGTFAPIETIVQIATVLGYDMHVSFEDKQ
jgi:DNA-binding XRE family transcriptional regulator